MHSNQLVLSLKILAIFVTFTQLPYQMRQFCISAFSFPWNTYKYSRQQNVLNAINNHIKQINDPKIRINKNKKKQELAFKHSHLKNSNHIVVISLLLQIYKIKTLERETVGLIIFFLLGGEGVLTVNRFKAPYFHFKEVVLFFACYQMTMFR